MGCLAADDLVADWNVYSKGSAQLCVARVLRNRRQRSLGYSSLAGWVIDRLEPYLDFGRLSDELEIAIFRIVQECLTNIHLHSGSTAATIRLHHEGDRLTVQVQDSGKGIPLEKQHQLIELGRGGVGFAGMRERLRPLGGTLEIKSDESGTLVSATLKVA